MRNRIISFLLFQAVAWTLYFNWEGPVDTEVVSGLSRKALSIEEVTTTNFASLKGDMISYKLVLRADGFYTKINSDQSVQNGLWYINHDLPTLLLSSSGKDRMYRILNQSGSSLTLELMEKEDIWQTDVLLHRSPRLFSSVN